MKVALFGGSFDPVHREHVALVREAVLRLGLNEVIVLPSFVAPHKLGGATASAEDRLALLKTAFRGDPRVTVSDFEIAAGGTSYSYLTCEHFKAAYPDSELFFLTGADMLENFFEWKCPERILSCATLVSCGRGNRTADGFHGAFLERFGCDYLSLPFSGREVSSTAIRTQLAFGKRPSELDDGVYGEIVRRGLYSHPAILPALSLEKEERREHSFRVALMAAGRARSAGVSEQKALLAAALHDCAKYLPLDAPELKGFVPPEGVPFPVMHQFSGAYVAEHVFGISDGEVLDAIRYHTSARENMTTLGKLVFLADMLEEGRTFKGAEELRALFYRDLDDCLFAALKGMTEYLESDGKPVYPLTLRAFEWLKSNRK